MTTAADHFEQILGLYHGVLGMQAVDQEKLATGLGIGCIARAHALICSEQFDIAHDLIAMATTAIMELNANNVNKNPDLMRMVVDRIARSHGIEPRPESNGSALSVEELKGLGLEPTESEEDGSEEDPIDHTELVVGFFPAAESCQCGAKATTYGIGLHEDDPPIVIWPSCEACADDEMKKRPAYVRTVAHRALLVRDDGTLAPRT